MQERGVEPAGELRQLIGGGVGCGDVVCNERDLDVRVEHPASAAGFLHLVGDVPDGSARGIDVTLGQVELRGARLRGSFPPARLPVLFFGQGGSPLLFAFRQADPENAARPESRSACPAPSSSPRPAATSA